MLEGPNRQPGNPKDDGAKLEGASFSNGKSSLRSQLPFICDLLFTEDNPRTSIQLFNALTRIEPDPRAYAPLMAALLNHSVTEIRVRSAQALARIPDAESDVLPVIYSAMQKERNEEARTAIKEAMKPLQGIEANRLARYYEELRYTTYAKKADLRDYSGGAGLQPEQIHRALVLLHLDNDTEAKQFASAALYQAVPIMTARQKSGLVLSIGHALSDPGPIDTYIACNLFYCAERLGPAAAPLIPLFRKQFDRPDGTLATGAALAVLWLKPGDEPAAELLRLAVRNKRSTEVVIDPPVPSEPNDEPLDFGPFYRFIEEVAGPGTDTWELEALEYSMNEARDRIYQVYERQIEELGERMKRASRDLSDLSREILMMKIANRLDRIEREASRSLLNELLDVMDDPSEPLRVRKAVAAYTAFNRTGNSELADRYLKVTCDFTQPPELRARACKSLAHLEFLNDTELDRVAFELTGLAADEPDPIVKPAAELALRNFKFFRENPAARYSFLFDKDGNLHPAVKQRLRDMISPD